MRLFDSMDLRNGGGEAPVSVNGVIIPEADILMEAQNHPAPSPAAARGAAAQALVVRELLLERARALGLDAPEEPDGAGESRDEALVRAVLEREVIVPSPTPEECRRFYDVHGDRFRSPDIFEASHILLSAHPEDKPAYTEASERAEGIAEELRAAPEKFATMAEMCSACPSASQGGNLGQITPGQTVPEFEDALADIGEGGIGVVRTRYGVHVVHVARVVTGEQMPFDMVHERIADYLADAVFHRAVHQYISLLAGQAEIEGVTVTQATSPLVQ